MRSFGTIHHQHTAPIRPNKAPRLMPQVQPSLALTHGVTIGASSPMPLPPVFMIAAAVPPRAPPVSTAVVQKAPSHKPRTPSDDVNQSTIQKVSRAKMPSSNSPALASMLTRGTRV